MFIISFATYERTRPCLVSICKYCNQIFLPVELQGVPLQDSNLEIFHVDLTDLLFLLEPRLIC